MKFEIEPICPLTASTCPSRYLRYEVLAFSLWLRQPFLLLHAALMDSVYGKKKTSFGRRCLRLSFRVLIRLLQTTDYMPADFTSAKLIWVASARSYPRRWNLAWVLFVFLSTFMLFLWCNLDTVVIFDNLFWKKNVKILTNKRSY
jgi:hypothetical protein